MENKEYKKGWSLIRSVAIASFVLVILLSMVAGSITGLSTLSLAKDNQQVSRMLEKRSIDQRDVNDPDEDLTDEGDIGDIYNPSDILRITSQPKASQFIVTGKQDLALRVKYEWTPGSTVRFTRQWYMGKSADLSTLKPINISAVPSAKEDTLTIPNAELGKGVYYFAVRIMGTSTVDNKHAELISRVAKVEVSDSIASTPEFVKQPRSSEVSVGTEVNIAGEATGNGTISYQWFSAPQASTDDATAIEGETQSKLEKLDTSVEGQFFYFLRAFNTVVDEDTQEEVTVQADSNIATITVGDLGGGEVAENAPVIDSISEAATVTVGDSTQLTVVAHAPNEEEDNLSYQWYVADTDSVSGGVLLDGASQDTLTVTPQKVGVQYYYVVVTNTLSTGELLNTISSTVAVTATQQQQGYTPIIVWQTDSPLDIILGETAILEVEATTPNGDTSNLTYQWYFSGQDSFEGSTILKNENAPKLNVTREVPGTNYYFVVITNTVEEGEFYTISSSIQVNAVESGDNGTDNGTGNNNGDQVFSGDNNIGTGFFTSQNTPVIVVSLGGALLMVGGATVLLVKSNKRTKQTNGYNQYTGRNNRKF